jgi:vitamin K-dependent gamma-carboxylase
MATNLVQQFKTYLNQPIQGQVLGLFRLAFGLFMFYQCIYYLQTKLIDDGFLKPYVLFKYEGFEFVEKVPRSAMFSLLGLLALSSLGMATGFLFRLSCWVFAIIQMYFLLLEKAYYNNHIYLFVLLAILLSVTDAHHWLSLKGGQRKQSVPMWQQFILQAQIVIVYFYAAIVKMKPDWLVMKQPMKILVESYPANKPLAWLFKAPGAIDFFTYGGLLLDLASPLLLWYKPIRRYAIIPFLLFHFTNSKIFDDIGVFPYLMAAGLILYYLPHELPFWRGNKPSFGKMEPSTTPMWLTTALIGYFAFQLLFPLRGLFLPNALDYTTIGNRFAWRVKADNRSVPNLTFYATNPATGQKLPVDVKVFLNPVQINHLAQDPRAVLQFAQALKREGERQGVKDIKVQADMKMSYNGRPLLDFIDPEIDLTQASYSVFEPIIWVNEPPDL